MWAIFINSNKDSPTMASSGLDRRPHGQLIAAAGVYQAFVPVALPPEIIWDEVLAISLSAADRTIGRLAGEGRQMSQAERCLMLRYDLATFAVDAQSDLAVPHHA